MSCLKKKTKQTKMYFLSFYAIYFLRFTFLGQKRRKVVLISFILFLSILHIKTIQLWFNCKHLFFKFIIFYFFLSPPTVFQDCSRNFTLKILLSLRGDSGLLVVMEKLIFHSHDFTQVKYSRNYHIKIL